MIISVDSLAKSLEKEALKSRTYGLLKPDAIDRAIDEIIYGMIEKSMNIEWKKRVRLTGGIISKLYPHNTNKKFFSDYVRYMTENDSEIFIASCEDNAIEKLNNIVGSLYLAEEDTIRHDLQVNDYFRQYKCCQNLIHSPIDEKACRRDLLILKEEGYLW
jgi:nucleoside diphosphate kinase